MTTLQYIPKLSKIVVDVNDYREISIKSNNYFIVIDSREKKLIYAASVLLRKNSDKILNFITAQLIYGDIHLCYIDDLGVITIVAIIERKTSKDFTSSIKDKRLDNIKLLSDYCSINNIIPFLLLEGVNKLYPRAPKWDDKNLVCKSYTNRINDMSIRMSLLQLVAKYNIKLLLSSSQFDSVIQLSALFKYLVAATAAAAAANSEIFNIHSRKKEISMMSELNTSGGGNDNIKIWRVKQNKKAINNIFNCCDSSNFDSNFFTALLLFCDEGVILNYTNSCSDLINYYIDKQRRQQPQQILDGYYNIIFYSSANNQLNIKKISINNFCLTLANNIYEVRTFNSENLNNINIFLYNNLNIYNNSVKLAIIDKLGIVALVGRDLIKAANNSIKNITADLIYQQYIDNKFIIDPFNTIYFNGEIIYCIFSANFIISDFSNILRYFLIKTNLIKDYSDDLTLAKNHSINCLYSNNANITCTCALIINLAVLIFNNSRNDLNFLLNSIDAASIINHSVFCGVATINKCLCSGCG